MKYMQAESNTKFCAQCRRHLPLSKFRSKLSGELYKGCTDCATHVQRNLYGNRCVHDHIKYTCKLCKGSSICEHNRIRYSCSKCMSKIRAIQEVQSEVTDEFKQHIASQFKPGMTWYNYSYNDSTPPAQAGWHIELTRPLNHGNPSLKEVFDRVHYTNIQPVWTIHE